MDGSKVQYGLRKGDIKAYVDFANKVHPKDPVDFAMIDDLVKRPQYDKDGHGIVRDQNGRIVADCLTYVDRNSRSYGDEASLTIKVLPRYEGDRELFSGLLEKGLKHLKKRKLKSVRSSNVNSEQCAYFEGAGFREVRRSYSMVAEVKTAPYIELPKGYRIRGFGCPKDIDPTSRAMNRAFEGTYLKAEAKPAVFKRFLKKDMLKEENIYVLEKGKNIIGGCIGTIENGVGDVHAVAVAPEERSKGLGRALLNTLFKYFYENGVKGVRLAVDAGDAIAVKLFTRAGFKVEAERVIYRKQL